MCKIKTTQGCMNNFTFGDEGMGYYETIAGGAGAGPHWHGRSGVHTHMTNTRITDPEILERRYPLVLHRFCLRPGSGGEGRWRGGDGVVREVEFLRPMTAAILSERRTTRPFGIWGGGDAQPGLNLLLKVRDFREGCRFHLKGRRMGIWDASMLACLFALTPINACTTIHYVMPVSIRYPIYIQTMCIS